MAALLLLAPWTAWLRGQPSPPKRRIIDVHLHAYASDASDFERRAPNPITGIPLTATTEDAHRQATLREMDRYNVVLGVVSNGTTSIDAVRRWVAAAPTRFLAGVGFDTPDEVTPQWIRDAHRHGQLQVIGEMSPPYAGYSIGDPAYEPYFLLAEELDLPIAIHAGTGAGRAAYNAFPKYRMEFNRPLHLEDLLVKHPRARVQLMHAGWPFLDETIALLNAHPQVYLDLGVISWTQPRAEFHAYLRRIVDAGYGQRIMFGSDQMAWPDTIGRAIEAVESAPFLSDAQKQAIFYDNAARFLRLPERANNPQ